MNFNVKDIYVVGYSYIHEDGEIVTGELVVFERDNALKVAEGKWDRLEDSDYAHVIVRPGRPDANGIIVECTEDDPIFNRETEYEDISRDDFWDDDAEYELAD